MLTCRKDTIKTPFDGWSLVQTIVGKIFGANLSKYRTDRGLSQQALAKAIGVSHATISYWESGRSLPTAPLLDKLSNALSVDFSDFFAHNPNMKLPPMRPLPKPELTEEDAYRLMSKYLPFDVKPRKRRPKKT